jgi:hypothetical protein
VTLATAINAEVAAKVGAITGASAIAAATTTAVTANTAIVFATEFIEDAVALILLFTV